LAGIRPVTVGPCRVDTRALRRGAVRIAYGEGGYLTWCKRAGIPFEVDLLRRDRHRFQAQLTDATRTGGRDPVPPVTRRDMAARFG
jgi:hypothetical protein